VRSEDEGLLIAREGNTRLRRAVGGMENLLSQEKKNGGSRRDGATDAQGKVARSHTSCWGNQLRVCVIKKRAGPELAKPRSRYHIEEPLALARRPERGRGERKEDHHAIIKGKE